MIAVFAGTSDGKRLVDLLLKEGLDVMALNGSRAGADMFESHARLKVGHEKLDLSQLRELLEGRHFQAVVDATHPYAQLITRNLLQVTQDLNIPYFRYERPDLDQAGFESYQAIIDYLKDKDGRVLITTGSNYLSYFTENLELDRLYARVLPTTSVINKCLDQGLRVSQIIGMQGPFSYEMNLLILKEKCIKFMVTKASGRQGGFDEKLRAAQAGGVELLVLKRPPSEVEDSYRSHEGLVKALLNSIDL